jgi:2-dehydro-3-deoxyglucarate aldolase/4-hydroxy-2-oxoheptanedioate aldolase
MGLRFKELLARDELVRVFALGRLLNPVTMDLFALAGGFHGCWLDQEHVGLTYGDVQAAAVAARANGFDCFVRMAPTNYAQVTQNLEAGAGGVMAAQIVSAAHAEEFVSWAKFGPRGMRGVNTSGRDGWYTHRAQGEFTAAANREHLVAIQIETLGALADVDAIAANDAVDLLFVGPADLSQAFGLQGQKDHPRVWEAYGQVAAACRKHGKHWGTVPADPAFAERCVEMGCRMISITGDVLAMRLGVAAAKTAYQTLFPGS